MQETLALARRLAPSGLSILLVGETGTGKELLAQEIHRVSARPGPLVDVNCAALPREMVEALLFGHRRGSFTSASSDAIGLVESAHRGTLFLDELQSLAPEAQPKLLRVLESGEIRRIGETRKRVVRLRTIAAAQPSLGRVIGAGGFREDLLQRLAGVVIHLPALHERRDDIPSLARHFGLMCGARPTDAAIDVLVDHEWPGNVRELRSAIERAACLAGSETISADTIRRALRLGTAQLVMLPRERGTESSTVKTRLLRVIAEHNWNAAAIAQALGVGRTTLFKELKEYGISLRELRTDTEQRVEHLSRQRAD
ncbi:MAG: sigma-54-dependent Fis family transcriptional regulator [Gemmatimonadetes bacterium]|nr:sigma-54-dependent Fis family transcriptional regulator [Gemmatimonadota bacterium]MBK8059782.1 sigma-54-dependent Fis family transcriptional regulator [Gemmatimonadota bacterium]